MSAPTPPVATSPDEWPEMSAQRSWLDVLAILEAHADTTELLLNTSPIAPSPSVNGQPAPEGLAPWNWAPPSRDALPPLPPVLADRATAIRDRMDALQLRISEEIDALPPSLGHHRSRHREPNPSSYIDLVV
ncbi:hypothetical protein [Jatrophihabitans sp. GAS493]|uniref:hypothetical protein n=1 Tax=Jatrophihabitans sp. GAS493 TaxID=1907575 RepID=UPI0012FDE8EB|nr:hypothetical protein [Jatrophihabitans sp. GAS493]